MLTDATKSTELQTRMLTDNPYTNTMCLGCGICSERRVCGGLSLEAQIVDCLHHCCGTPDFCTKVCANNTVLFPQQVREIGGFDLDSTPRAPVRAITLKGDIVELIYHGSRRSQALDADIVALRLADVVDFRRKRSKHSSAEQLRETFRLAPDCKIILTGVDHDHRIESWWSLGSARPAIIRGLVALGIHMVTTPNFSLVLDHPRWDDLHAMKRIALVFAEFQENGLACALHPNGRTFQDFERWMSFVVERPEVQALAYEFITGPDRTGRRQFHLDRLAELAAAVNRPLDIIMRGNPQVIPFLRGHFRKVIYIDTTAFIKTQKRRIAERVANSALEWVPFKTPPKAFLDPLLRINLEEQVAYLRAAYYSLPPLAAKAA
ncbi:hypothetical protein [Mesorhizobium sp. M0130]|uniref:hypothetical protein n=1 Tax=Mesorhizobium sp. M0130 TaxID=2956887 RepID=UPI0033397A44